MGLHNDQYNQIQREYDRRRQQAHHDLDERIRWAEARIPELKDIRSRMAETSVKYAKLSLGSETVDFEELKILNHSLALEKEHLLKKNGLPEDYLKPHYSCPLCKDTGIVDGKKCRCFQQAVVDLLYSQSFLQNRLREENFQNFRYDYYSKEPYKEDPSLGSPYDNIIEQVDLCKTFLRNFDYSHENILIYGKTGVGKTFLSNCIAKELLQSGHTVIYLSAPQLFEIIETYKFSKNKEDDPNDSNIKIQYIFDCDLLIIDDLGTEFNNSFISSQLYYCMNERYLRQKSTLISTNQSFKEIRENYSDRIYSRLFNDYTLMKIYGEDIRIQKARADE